MVISPLSPGGLGRQLPPSKARRSVVNPRNGRFREIVFLMRPLGLSPQSSLWGLLVYTTDSGLLGIVNSVEWFGLSEICVISNLIVVVSEPMSGLLARKAI